MLRILLVLLICNNVISDDDESNKYIDLLPEKEKREFLDRIARRILEEIKSKGDPNTSHAEISDEQLDAQAAFVQGILKEESENLKKKRRDNKESNVAEVKVENKEEHDNQDRYIDLTLRTGVRRKRNHTDVVPLERIETTSEPDQQTIIVETVYDQGTSNHILKNRQGEDLNDITHQTEINENNTEASSTFALEDVTTTNLLIESTTEDITLSSVALDQTNLRKSFQDKSSLSQRTTILTDFEPNSTEISSESNINNNVTISPLITQTVSEILYQNYNHSTTEGKTHLGLTQKIFEHEGPIQEDYSEDENDTTVYVNVSIPADKIDTTFVTLSSSAETNTMPTLETTEVISFETSSHPNVIARNANPLRNGMIPEEIEKHNATTTSNKIDVTNAIEEYISHNITTGNLDNNNELTNSTAPQEFPLDEQETTITESDYKIEELKENMKTSSIPVLTELSIEKVETTRGQIYLHNKSMDEDQVHNKSQADSHTLVDTKIEKVLDNPNKYLRSDIVRQEQDSAETAKPKFKTYEVYEIAPNKPPFLKQASKSSKTPTNGQDEQPHYANVYNYDPSNAYFNPYNRLGPNTQSLEETNIIKDFTVKDTSENDKNEYETDNTDNNLYLRSRFHGYNKREHIPVPHPRPKVTKNINDFMNIFKKVTSDNAIYFHAYDYPDYYLERNDRPRKMYSYTGKRFPDSSEYDHPINFLHNSESIKDHIRAARYLLYLQKRFGYVPIYNQTVTVRNKTAVNETAIKNKNMRYYQNAYKKRGLANFSKTTLNPIAMDYYFDRGSEEVDEIEVNGRDIKNNFRTFINVPVSEIYKDDEPNSVKEGSTRSDTDLSDRVSYKSLLVVLGDMIKLDNSYLTKYNWLQTTVDIRAAIAKVHGLINDFHFDQKIHPKDVELLKYIFYLYKSSKLKLGIGERIHTGNILRKRGVLPRNKRKRRIQQPLKVMRDFISFIRDQNNDPDDQPFMVLHELEDVLNEVLFQLDDFHSALKRIAQSRTLRTHNWYDQLKNNFFQDASKRQLGQVILHLVVYNLLDLVDNSARSGLEDGFKPYVRGNPDIVDKSRKEFIFVLEVLQKLREE